MWINVERDNKEWERGNWKLLCFIEGNVRWAENLRDFLAGVYLRKHINNKCSLTGC